MRTPAALPGAVRGMRARHAPAALLTLTAVLLLPAALTATPPRLAIAVPTHGARHFIFNVSRATWRSSSLGVRTLVSTDNAAAGAAADAAERVLPTPWPHEVWVAGPDGTFGWETRGGNKAEERCTGVLRLANASLPRAQWFLNGDDDVIWLLDNVPALVAGLDPAAPFFITDGFLNGVQVACSRAGEQPTGGAGGCVRTRPAQPCFRDVLNRTDSCFAGAMGNWSAGTQMTKGLAIWAYGDAGAVWSRGLLESISAADFAACEHCVSGRFTCEYGADVRLGECAWAFGGRRRGVGPTLPYPSAPFRAFGFPADELLREAERVAERDEACEDERCVFALRRAVSTHIGVHGVSNAEYAAQVSRLWDVYSRAKARLAQRDAAAAAAATDNAPPA